MDSTPTVDLDTLADAVGEVLGAPVAAADLEEIRVAPRSSVYRALVAGRSVVVKLGTDEFGPIRERAFLDVVGPLRLPSVVPYRGASDRLPVVVLEDLGERPSLADLLLGSDPDAATAGLSAWIDASVEVQRATRSHGGTFRARLSELHADAAPDYASQRGADAVDRLGEAFARMDVTVPDAALDEILACTERLALTGADDLRGAVAAGDGCPDNNAVTDAGVMLFDFEGGEHRHVAWDIAYLRAPWPTCWCTWALPPEVSAPGLDRWMSSLDLPTGELREGVEAATTIWSAQIVTYQMPRAIDGAEHPKFASGQSPPIRALAQERLRRITEAHHHAPQLAATAQLALERTIDAWGDHPLAVAPAWR